MVRKVVGIDLDHLSIRVAEVVRKGKSKSVSKVATATLPEGTIVDGKIKNIQVVTKTLEDLLVKQEITATSAWLGLRNSWITVKTHRLPQMGKKELDKALEFEIPELVSFPVDNLDDVAYDYFINWEMDSEMEIVLVACPRIFLDPYIKAINFSGLTLESIDLAALSWPDLLADDLKRAYVEVSETQTTIFIALKGSFKVLRVVPVGTEHFSSGIVEAFGCTKEDAYSYCLHRDLDYLLMEGTSNKRIIRATVQQFVGSVLQTLDFVRAQERAAKFSNMLDEVVIFGDLADLQGLAAMLEAEVDLPVRALKQVEQLALDLDFIRPEKFSRYGTALALALRGVEK